MICGFCALFLAIPGVSLGPLSCIWPRVFCLARFFSTHVRLLSSGLIPSASCPSLLRGLLLCAWLLGLSLSFGFHHSSRWIAPFLGGSLPSPLSSRVAGGCLGTAPFPWFTSPLWDLVAPFSTTTGPASPSPICHLWFSIVDPPFSVWTGCWGLFECHCGLHFLGDGWRIPWVLADSHLRSWGSLLGKMVRKDDIMLLYLVSLPCAPGLSCGMCLPLESSTLDLKTLARVRYLTPWSWSLDCFGFTAFYWQSSQIMK